MGAHRTELCRQDFSRQPNIQFSVWVILYAFFWQSECKAMKICCLFHWAPVNEAIYLGIALFLALASSLRSLFRFFHSFALCLHYTHWKRTHPVHHNRGKKWFIRRQAVDKLNSGAFSNCMRFVFRAFSLFRPYVSFDVHTIIVKHFSRCRCRRRTVCRSQHIRYSVRAPFALGQRKESEPIFYFFVFFFHISCFCFFVGRSHTNLTCVELGLYEISVCLFLVHNFSSFFFLVLFPFLCHSFSSFLRFFYFIVGKCVRLFLMR